MGRRAVVGVDLGTSSAKAVAYDAGGEALAAATVETPVAAPAPGRAESDPEDAIAALVDAVARVTAHVALEDVEVAGLACSAAMHCLLGLDADDRPVTPAVLFADTRAAEQAERLRASDPDLARRTGTPVHAMSPLAKLAWYAEADPAAAELVTRWASTKELLLTRLTGERVTDTSIASATGLYAIVDGAWDSAALGYAGVTADALSTPVATGTVLDGGIDTAMAEAMGLDPSTPVVVGAADGCLANLGAGAVDPGVGALTISTSGAIRVLVDRPSGDPDGRLFCYALTDDRWCVGGPVSNGGSVLTWARDQLLVDTARAATDADRSAYAVFDELAAEVAAGCEGLLVVPSLSGERAPLWDATLTAGIVGLTARHGRGHLLRGLLEGVAYQLATVLQAVEETAGDVVELRANGGFTASRLWPQVVADVLGRPLRVPRESEATCLGAALLGFAALDGGDPLALARDAAPVEATVTPDEAVAGLHRANLARFVAARDALRALPADPSGRSTAGTVPRGQEVETPMSMS